MIYPQLSLLISTRSHTMEIGARWCVMAAALLVQDDLICLPPRVATGFGNIFPVVLCTRVTNVLTLVDPSSLRTLHIDVSPASSHSATKRMQPWCYRSNAPILSQLQLLHLSDMSSMHDVGAVWSMLYCQTTVDK